MFLKEVKKKMYKGSQDMMGPTFLWLSPGGLVRRQNSAAGLEGKELAPRRQAFPSIALV